MPNKMASSGLMENVIFPKIILSTDEVEGRDVKQDYILNMGQLEFSHVPVKVWITDPDVHGLIDGPCGGGKG